jgi:hypothetical protein
VEAERLDANRSATSSPTATLADARAGERVNHSRGVPNRYHPSFKLPPAAKQQRSAAYPVANRFRGRNPFSRYYWSSPFVA